MQIQHHFGGGVYAKECFIPAGQEHEQHVHKFDHLSVLAYGVAEVTVDGATTKHVGPTCLTIHAGKSHKVRAITDLAWYCIHASEETDPSRIDETLIEEK